MTISKPTNSYVMAAWACLAIGGGGFMLGLYNADTLGLSEKGFYLIGILFSLYSAISLQKTLRDKEEGIPTTSVYTGITWFSMIASVALMAIGLWNADLLPSEKGFYGMSFLLASFAVVTVQKNTRDIENSKFLPKEVKTNTQKPRVLGSTKKKGAETGVDMASELLP